MALARGDLAAAAERAASIRAALDGVRYKDEQQLPMARLESEVRLAQGRPAEALAAVDERGRPLQRAGQPAVRVAAAGRGRPGLPGRCRGR